MGKAILVHKITREAIVDDSAKIERQLTECIHTFAPATIVNREPRIVRGAYGMHPVKFLFHANTGFIRMNERLLKQNGSNVLLCLFQLPVHPAEQRQQGRFTWP
ncbi:hypothetical protein D3C84_711960 [compost metagenome]